MSTNIERQSPDLASANKSKRKLVFTADTLASFEDVSKRAKDLSSKLSSLCEEFPETNLILDYEMLQSSVETTVQNYKDLLIKNIEEGKANKKNKEESETSLSSLPNEVLQNCLLFLGKGHYGTVALVSKKLREAYREAFVVRVNFGRRTVSYYKQETAYLEMATSIKLVKHCLKNLCQSPEERDELFRAAAVNGNLDILRAVVQDGHYLSTLVEMKKETLELYDDLYGDYEQDVYDTDDEVVQLNELVYRDHLHVLKYLHEELNYHEGLQRYVKPAIGCGQLEILEFLRSIGCMDENDKMHKYHYEPFKGDYQRFAFCDEAIRSGKVKSLLWLLDRGYEISPNISVMKEAIRSHSLEMIQYCFDKGYPLDRNEIESAIRNTNYVKLYRLLHELGFEFRSISEWMNYHGSDISSKFDVIKFLRSISIPWDEDIMNKIVEHGTLEMIEYAHKDGCPWTNSGDEYHSLLRTDGTTKFLNGEGLNVDNSQKWKYLIRNGCKFDYERSSIWTKENLIKVLRTKKDLELLQFFVGKNSNFDNQLFKYFLKHSEGELWFGGISYVLKNGADSENICRSIGEVSQSLPNYKTSSDGAKKRLFDLLRSKKDLRLLEDSVGKNSSFDNELFQYILDHSRGELWMEGIFYLLKNGKDN